jgi:hypothetical protein
VSSAPCSAARSMSFMPNASPAALFSSRAG